MTTHDDVRDKIFCVSENGPPVTGYRGVLQQHSRGVCARARSNRARGVRLRGMSSFLFQVSRLSDGCRTDAASPVAQLAARVARERGEICRR